MQDYAKCHELKCQSGRTLLVNFKKIWIFLTLTEHVHKYLLFATNYSYYGCGQAYWLIAITH